MGELNGGECQCDNLFDGWFCEIKCQDVILQSDDEGVEDIESDDDLIEVFDGDSWPSPNAEAFLGVFVGKYHKCYRDFLDFFYIRNDCDKESCKKESCTDGFV